jgi:hypothetical protein
MNAAGALPAVFPVISQTRDRRAVAAALRHGDLDAVDPKTGAVKKTFLLG